VITVSQVAVLTASNGMEEDLFGTAVAIHGKYILAGAYGVDNDGSDNIGSAYLFGNPSTDPNNPEWMQLTQFQPNDLNTDDWFGVAVAMDDNIAVIGTFNANAAYVFAPLNDEEAENSSSLLSSWTQLTKLTGSSGSNFGFSVGVAGDWIVVGAYDGDDSSAGAVFVYMKAVASSSLVSWTQMAQLLPVDGLPGDHFGRSVSISKDASTIVVGSEYNDFSTTITNSGAIYLFLHTNPSMTTTTATVQWTQMGKFVTADQESNDNLGNSISIENNTVVVGADGDDSTSGFTNAGSVSVFDTRFWAPTTSPTALTPTFRPTSIPTSPFTTVAPSLYEENKGSYPPVTESPTSIPSTITTQSPVGKEMDPTKENPMDDAATVQPSFEDQSNGDSKAVLTPGVIVGVAAIVVLGVGGVAALMTFFNYRLKREERQQQQQQQQHEEDMNTVDDPAQPTLTNNIPAAVLANNENEASCTPIMAAVLFPPAPQTELNRTLEADVFLDPATAVSPLSSSVGKGLPRYKDQVRSFEPPGSYTNIGSSSSKPQKTSQKSSARKC
jgi:hypothetical protein